MTLQQYVDSSDLIFNVIAITCVYAFLIFAALFSCFMFGLACYLKILEWKYNSEARRGITSEDSQ